MSTTVHGDMLRTYYKTLLRVAKASEHIVRSIAKSHDECEWIAGQWCALARTFEVLSLVSSYRNIGTYADTSASGLPNNMVIQLIDQFKVDSAKNLDISMPIDALKHRWLDAVGKDSYEADTLLRTMRERYAFEYLDKHDILGQFTPGPILEVTAGSTSRRAYLISWSGYDPARLIPFAYGALVEQDVQVEPLSKESATTKKMWGVIKNEGYYREAGIMGSVIDDRIPWLHPKMVHSFALRRVITHQTLGTDDWSVGLEQHDTSREGYVAFVRHEIARSHGESLVKNINATRERWLTPPGSPELKSALVFERDDRIVMPHAVAQLMHSRLRANVARILTIEELNE